MTKTQLQYGLWPSPVSPRSLAGQRRLSDVAWDGERLVWLEVRSGHGMAMVQDMDGTAPRELTPDTSIRARVGYGGGDLTVDRNTLYFAHQGRLYRQPLDSGSARPITPGFGDCASPAVSPDGQQVAYVHTYEEQDAIACVAADGSSWPTKMASGADFYAQPAWSTNGASLAWIEWDHPNMPWDGTRLCLRCVSSQNVSDSRIIAGGPATAVQQPTFSPDGRYLAYVSDETGWGGLYLHNLETNEGRALVTLDADLALPMWVQGIRTYAWSPDGGSIYFLQNDRGAFSLHMVDVQSGAIRELPNLDEYSRLGQIAVSATGKLAFIASGAATPARVIVYDPAGRQPRVVTRSAAETVSAKALSKPQAIQWATSGGETANGIYYPPASEMFESGGKPPLILQVHGGPTGQATMGSQLGLQFFATRGYAVLDLNYRGSTGFGRAYQQRLRENWGILDVEDAVSGAQHLVSEGLVDPARMVIMGGSAGGYTVLQTLVNQPGVFRAGICKYGVTNLFTLAADTHKFEARYLDSMIGPLPEASQAYHDRSPIYFVDNITDPVAVFQGEIDRVVPLAQAETVVAALRRNGVPHEYHVYKGEGHGWRLSETILAYYDAVLGFLKQYVIYS